MAMETLLDLAQIVLVAAVPWGIHLSYSVMRIMEMQENLEKVTLGSNLIPLLSEIRDAYHQNAVAVNALTHYIVWMAEQQTGKTPPPHVPKVTNE